MHLELIDYKTNSKARKHLIESSDLIVYVCCTNNEIRKLRDTMKIGLNDFHHDYNLIHFYETYQKKCLNVTFNANIKDLKSSNNTTNTSLSTNYFSQSKSGDQAAIASLQSKNQFNQNMSEKDLSFVILPSVSTESSTNHSMSLSLFSNIQPTGNSAYLKLPQENDKFISYLFEQNKPSTCAKVAGESKAKRSFKSMRSALNDMPFKLLIGNINKTLTNLVK